ncbi:hypothetical protein NP493_334g03025 [Ridgeia piscesae]|uniref:Rab-GAP TBC domain-containing protein n=1 Tax=Ridgeia piscesae TaxID=27915 RepID=A0AAD9NU37_RIDPI|nr:hypothetical protein NP493_334g03025 [Ridgeia piscesae]
MVCCSRLYPDLSFFQSASSYPCRELVGAVSGFENLRRRVEHSVLKSQNVGRNRLGITIADYKRSRKPCDEYVVLEEGEEAHWEVVERMLFLYSKLNPGQGYVQGMNEIIGPIYYTFAADSSPQCQEYAEADTFWCFNQLMGEIRDNFIKQLDDSHCGIGMLMDRLMTLLKEKDTALWVKLHQQDLKPQYYGFRWIMLLLSQEFPLPDVIRLWDSLLADENRFDFLIDVCCAMLL